MNLKTVFLSFGFSCVLAGCGTPTVYEHKQYYNTKADIPANPSFSEAKQFAQAMNLKLIDDDGDNYKLFAAYGRVNSREYRTKLKEPISIKEINRQITIGRDHSINLANAGLGMIHPIFGFLSLDTSSWKERFIPHESHILLGHWGDVTYTGVGLKEDIRQLYLKINPILAEDITEAVKSGVDMDCENPRMARIPVTENDSDSGDFEATPKPPHIQKPYFTLANFDICDLMVYQRSEGKLLPKFVEISKMLGNDYAIYLPSTLKSEPVILHDGEVLKFHK